MEDIYKVIEGNGGWDKTITKFLADGISEVAEERFGKERIPRDTLGMSAVGTPCSRKLWYRINTPSSGSQPSSEALGTFFYGDLLEVLVLALAKAAGHSVEGLQDELEINEVKGHRDAVIDGMTVDVKSASAYSYNKFVRGELRDDDPFGYISQLSSYVFAGRYDPLVTYKSEGAFLVVRKDRFQLHLDVHDFREELGHKENEINEVKRMLQGPMPERKYEDVADGYYKGKGSSRVFVPNGNRILDRPCTFCEFKNTCWPDIRVFEYYKGPKFYTHIVKEPNVKEVT